MEKIKHETSFKSDKKQLVFLILLAVAIMVLIVCIVLLIRYKDEIMSDPLIYGMERHEFSYCSCRDINGYGWESVIDGDKKGFQNIPMGSSIKLDTWGE